jgi:hypothetical protein
MKSAKKRRGFLFVITVFLILTYMMLSISIWVKSLEASERAYSEIYKESTVELAIDQLTHAKVANISDMVLNRAVFRINDLAKDHALKEGPEEDRYYYVKNAIYEYVINGSPSGNNFHDAYEPEAEGNASLGGWASTLNASLLAIGVYIDDFEIYDFTFDQEDYKTLSYSFRMNLSMRDTGGTTSLTRTYEISNRIPITGLVDPAMARESGERGETIYRQFFFWDDYLNKDNLAPERITNIDEGQGWFYGPVVTATEATAVDDDLKRRYIVAGTYDEIRSLGEEDLMMFGAFILTNDIGEGTACDSTHINQDDTFRAIRYEGVTCGSVSFDPDTEMPKPFVVAPSFDIGNAPLCMDVVENATKRCVLIIANSPQWDVQSDVELKLRTPTESTGIFGIEELRDYTMCGYYTLDENAPSYFQRLLADPYTRSGEEMGIETFMIGEYADPSIYERLDSIDRKTFEEAIRDEFIRGMPGCREYGSCSNDETPTGRFGLNESSITDYTLDAIDCGSGAECGG